MWPLKSNVVLFVTLFCASASTWAASTGQKGDECVPLARLIASPDVFVGKALWVVANVSIGLENMSACPTEEDRDEKGCLWLTLDDGPHTTDQEFARYQAKLQIWKRFNLQTVAIHATFDKSETGHFGMWPGGLSNITEVVGTQGGWNFTTSTAVPGASAGCPASSAPMPASSSTSSAKTSEGDGSSEAEAINISAASEFDGVAAEHAWLEHHFPGAQLESQALVMGTHPYDLMTMTLPSGENRKVYFDISSFFGK